MKNCIFVLPSVHQFTAHDLSPVVVEAAAESAIFPGDSFVAPPFTSLARPAPTSATGAAIAEAPAAAVVRVGAPAPDAPDWRRNSTRHQSVDTGETRG